MVLNYGTLFQIKSEKVNPCHALKENCCSNFLNIPLYNNFILFVNNYDFITFDNNYSTAYKNI